MNYFYIEKILAKNFRNLEYKPINFFKKINCIFGPNGNGKTNILEVIYFIFKKKSFRKNTTFPQLLSIDGDKPELLISAIYYDLQTSHSLSTRVLNDKADYYLDNVSIKKLPSVNIVLINPYDSFMFFNTASERRNWFDQHLSMLDTLYSKSLNNYSKTLRFRNAILAKKNINNEDLLQIKILDGLLGKYGYPVIKQRIDFCEKIASYCNLIFKKIFSENFILEINYKTQIKKICEESIKQFMQEGLEEDLKHKTTKNGIHLDDYHFFLNGNNSLEYSSMGQQKMTFLSLVFAFSDFLTEKSKKSPIFLIDDISSELDSLRWKNLIQYLDKKEAQVFITTANENFFQEVCKVKNVNKILVNQGVILN